MSERKKRPRFSEPSSPHPSTPKHKNEDHVNPSKIPQEISERHHVEEMYRMLAAAAEQSIDGIAITDMQGAIRFCNDAWAAMHGYDVHELFGKDIKIFHTPQQMQKEVVPFYAQVRERGAYHGEINHLKKDGTVFTTRMTITLLRDEKEDAIGFVCIARDIASSKKLEEQQEASEARYKMMVDYTPDCEIFFGRDGKVMYVNPAFERIFGYTREEHLSGEIAFADLVHPDDAVKVQEYLAKMRHKESFCDIELRAIRKDGGLIYLSGSSQPVTTATGEFTGSRLSIRDITERKNAEQAFRASEEQNRAILEALPDLIFRFSAEGVFLDYHAQDEAMLVAPPYEFLGKKTSEVLDKDLSAQLMAAIGRVLQTHQQQIIEYSILVHGKQYYRESRLVPCGEDEVLCIVRDVTEYKQTQEVLSRSESQYRTTIDSMGDAIHVVDRDLVIVLFNKAFEKWNKTLGLQTKAAGKRLFEVFPFLPEKVRDEYEKVFVQGKILITEEENSFGDRLVISETRKIPVFDNGKAAFVVTVIRDITEQRRTESETKKLKRQIEFILGATKTGVDIIDSDFNLRYVDPGWQKTYGAYQGRKCYEYFMGRKTSCPNCAIPAALNTKSVVVSEEILPKEGNRAIQVTTMPFQDENGEWLVAETNLDITERKKAENRVALLNKCFLQFIADPDENINRLVALCGEVMEADCALYNRLNENLLCSIGKWNTPVDYPAVDKAEGHICYDVITKGNDDILVIRDLASTAYAKSDPNVSKFRLQTYVGMPVKCTGAAVGSLCVVYQKDYILNDADKRFMQIIASAIAVEEQRRLAKEELHQSEEKYRFLFEESPAVSLVLDQSGRVKNITKSAMINLGYSREDIVGHEALEFIVAKDRHRVSVELKKIFLGEFTGELDVDVHARDGSIHSLLFSAGQTLLYEKGQVTGVLITGIDVTERKQNEQRQRALTIGLRAVAEIADELISCPDEETVFRLAVERARTKLGLERCAIFLAEGGFMHGVYGTDLSGRITDEHAHRFVQDHVWSQYVRMLQPQDPRWVVMRDSWGEWDGSRIVPVGIGWIVLTPIQSARRPIGVFVNDAAISKTALDETKQDTLAVFCSLLGNIIERKRAEKELAQLNRELLKSNRRFKEMALRDSHTGLYNHRYLQEALESELGRAQRYVYALSVVMFDLDYFKSINDVYGHQFGDLVLKQFSRQLKKTVRRYDTVIRFGGEEFVVLSPGTDKTTTLALAQRILDTINVMDFGNKEHSVKLKLSIAVATYPEDNIVKGMDLIELADRILNKAKEDGGDRVYSFEDIKKGKRAETVALNENPEVSFLKEKIERLNKRANQSLIEAVFAFAKTLQLKDHYTGDHVERTVFYATEIAHRLNLSKDEIEHLRQAAKLHDLGKIGISEKILLKRAKLNEREFAKIKQHTQIGADILRPIHFFRDIIPLVLYHHERWDGAGYPAGLKKDEIPIGARILSIADVYQALISDRPYRKGYSREEALRIIQDGAGTQFDPTIVEQFMGVLTN